MEYHQGMSYLLEVPVEGLSRDAGVAADLAHGDLIKRFVHCMKNFHLDAQIGRSEMLSPAIRSVIMEFALL